MSELLTTAEVAKRYRIGEQTIRNWAKSGRIPSIRLGYNCLRFDAAAVEAALMGQSPKAVDHV